MSGKEGLSHRGTEGTLAFGQETGAGARGEPRPEDFTGISWQRQGRAG